MGDEPSVDAERASTAERGQDATVGAIELALQNLPASDESAEAVIAAAHQRLREPEDEW